MLYLAIMLNRDRVQEASPTSYASWAGYSLRFGGFVLSFFVIGLGLLFDLRMLLIVGLIFLAGSIFLFMVTRWATNRLYEDDQLRIIEKLFSMSQAQPEDKLAVIDLGIKRPAITLSQYLTTGQVIVIDVFNPQLTNGRALAGARRKAPSFQFDPRLAKFDGRIDLLPLPDNSVSAVFMPLILSEFSQHGDRQTLIKEVFRILKPNGRLLCAEQNNTWRNWLSIGPESSRLQPWAYWQKLITDAGFEIVRHEEMHSVTLCFRANKPSPFAGKQLALNLSFDSFKT